MRAASVLTINIIIIIIINPLTESMGIMSAADNAATSVVVASKNDIPALSTEFDTALSLNPLCIIPCVRCIE